MLGRTEEAVTKPRSVLGLLTWASGVFVFFGGDYRLLLFLCDKILINDLSDLTLTLPFSRPIISLSWLESLDTKFRRALDIKREALCQGQEVCRVKWPWSRFVLGTRYFYRLVIMMYVFVSHWIRCVMFYMAHSAVWSGPNLPIHVPPPCQALELHHRASSFFAAFPHRCTRILLASSTTLDLCVPIQ